jgi:hypothetical protein
MKHRFAFALAAAAALLAGAAAAATDVSWTRAEMTRSGDTVVTNGTLVYAYCQSNQGRSVTNTVNTVPFVGLQDISPSGDFCFTNNWSWYLNNGQSTPPANLEPAYSNLLAHGWYSTAGEHALRLNGLTPGSTYAVQLILANWDTSHGGAPGHTVVWAPGSDTVFANAGWTYGGMLAGTFTARSATESFVFKYENGNAFLNAIQVREIATGGQAPVDPSIGSVAAVSAFRRATVSLSGVVMGTDIDCNPASYYTGSDRLSMGADVVRETGLPAHQTGAATSFAISNLDEGDYVCEVAIETDQGKTASATVAFTILPAGNFDALKAAIEGAGAGGTVQVAKGYYVATSTINATAAGLTVVAKDGKDVTILDGGSSNRLMKITGSGTVVQGVTFKGGRNSQGGAVKLDGDALRTAKILDCDFIECTAKYGGAIFALDSSHADYDAPSAYGLVRGCTFLRCGVPSTEDMWGAGGAIYGALQVEGSVFDACYVDTSVKRQSSIAATSHMTASDCVFKNQSPGQYGIVGTAHGLDNNEFANGAIRLAGCTVQDNELASQSALFRARVWVDRCVIANNTATTEGLVPLYSGPKPGASKVTSCLFADNGFPFKMNGDALPPLYNCTFVRNVGGLAFDMDSSSTRPAITNCLFWGNLPKTSWPFNTKFKGAPGLYYHPDPATSLPGRIQIGNTVVEGGSANEDVAAVLDADASGASARLTALADAREGKGIRFADASKDDWRPQSKSPLTNAGVLCDWMAGARDLAGRPRAFGGAPDVGCYEFFGDPPTLLILR